MIRRKYAQIYSLLEEQGPFVPRLEKIRQIIQQPDFKYDQQAGPEILESIFLHSSYWLRLDLFDESYLYKNDPQNLLPIQKLHLQMVDIGVSLLNKGFPLEFKPERYTQNGLDILAPYAKAFSEQCHKRHAFLNSIKTKMHPTLIQQYQKE